MYTQKLFFIYIIPMLRKSQTQTYLTIDKDDRLGKH
jgi:hypothetical protein